MHFCLDDSPFFKLIELNETDSTNTFLTHYQACPSVDVVLVTAEYQTAGRGQTGNTWESAPGCNLLFSILVRPSALPASQLFSLSEAIALSLQAAVSESLSTDGIQMDADQQVTVKWPNDIYIGDRKVAGILIETELQGNCVKKAVIGVGLNVNQPHFESNAPNPVSLSQLSGHTYERSFILASIMGHFRHWYTQIQQGNLAPLHAAYRRALYRGGADSFWPYEDVNGVFMASVADVEPDGHLVLLDKDGARRRYAFKEVAFILRTPAHPEPPKSGLPG